MDVNYLKTLIRVNDPLTIFKNIAKDKNYKIFEGLYNLNIWGIRCGIEQTAEYDDLLAIWYIYDKCIYMSLYQITTDPSDIYLQSPMNTEGCAILVEGQYRSALKVGLHKGKWALKQVRPMKVYRDNNKDNILDFDPKTIREGLYGIDLHNSSEINDPIKIGKWSAGCQVVYKNDDWKEIKELITKSESIYGDTFTYTLININDITERITLNNT